MSRYEYKVVPAPAKGLKGKGVKGPEARFSNAIQALMNTLAEEGWEYQRAETLPSIERSGLTSSTTEWRNVFVFRRPRQDDADAFTPELLPPPVVAPVVPVPAPAVAEATTPDDAIETAQDPAESDQKDEAENAPASDFSKWDNGVEDAGEVEDVGPTLETLAASRNKAKTDS